MSATTMAVLAILTALSLIYVNFWCRYLCPYGALLGLASILSPFKVRRDEQGCTGCQRCSRACPSGLPIHNKETIHSPECTGCLACVANCPERNVLRMAPPLWRRPLPVWLFPAVVVVLFAVGVGTGMATGNWQSSLGYADFRLLIPMTPYLSH